MRVFPEQDRIGPMLEAAGGGVLLYTRLVADLETPVSSMLKLGAGQKYACLLESVEGGNVLGRFSIIALDPDLVWTVDDDKASTAAPDGTPAGADDPDVFASLRSLIEASRILMRPQIVVIFDRLKAEMTICTPVRKDGEASPEEAWEQGRARLEAVVGKLDAPIGQEAGGEDTAPIPEFASNMPREGFLDMVRKGVEYIKAGDVFQVVLSQRFSIPFALPPMDLYRALRRLNPSPFLICFDFGDFSLVGSSPEILVRLRDGKVTIRPVAGTRPRGATPEEDQAMADELMSDAKERAEHLMLLDLGRNDAGRVSEPGSVRVVESFEIERYSHVMHIASEVEGRIRGGLDAVDALMAGFPAGTVSGAPKIRAMEIIDELEPCRRGPYSGAAGYISADGDMDTCIILRTAILKGGEMHAQAGGGIVYDSVPDKEFEETENKAMALIRAAAEAISLRRRGGNA